MGTPTAQAKRIKQLQAEAIKQAAKPPPEPPRPGQNAKAPRVTSRTAVLDRAIEQVVSSDDLTNGTPAPPLIVRAASQEGRPGKQIVTVRNARVTSVRETILRIQHECDPIGFLMNVINGAVFEAHEIGEDGQPSSFYESPTLQARIKVAQFLAHKVAPAISIQQHQLLSPPEEVVHNDPMRPGMPSFAQLVQMAASIQPSGQQQLQPAGPLHAPTDDRMDPVVSNEDEDAS